MPEKEPYGVGNPDPDMRYRLYLERLDELGVEKMDEKEREKYKETINLFLELLAEFDKDERMDDFRNQTLEEIYRIARLYLRLPREEIRNLSTLKRWQDFCDHPLVKKHIYF